MLKGFTKLSKKLLGLSTRTEVAPRDLRVEFSLKYKHIPVGQLSLKDSEWVFSYTPEFRLHHDLRPIVEFPDIERVYSSKALWPFFQMRIPSRTQASVDQVIRREQIAEDDEAAMLSRFGRRTISNPYELIRQGELQH
jgi:HipA-like protein